jgi:hypothetical protein
MRWTILVILAISTPASAGGYLFESIGGASYSGDLSRFGSGAPRLIAGIGVSRGPWAVEVFGGGFAPDLFYIDCYGDECAAAATPSLELVEFGVDLRRSWRVLHSTYTKKIGLDFVLHGGPRFYMADLALPGYQGLGIGGGAAIDANFKVVSMFIDFTTDFIELHGEGRTFFGRLPGVQIGMRFGWM